MQTHRLRVAARATTSLASLLLAAFTVHAVEVVDGPTLTMDPNGRTPLAGVVELTTDTPVEAQLTITFGSDTRTVSFPGASQQHFLPVLGLKPDRTYTVDVELVPGGPVGTLFATTAPLPSTFLRSCPVSPLQERKRDTPLLTASVEAAGGRRMP